MSSTDVSIYALIIVGFANVGLSLFVLLRNWGSKSSLYFGLFIVSIAFWSIGLSNFIREDNLQIALNWAKIYYIAPLYIAYFALLFSYVFPKEKDLTLFRKLFLAVPATLISLALIFVDDYQLRGVIGHSWGKEVILGNWEYFIYSVYFITYFYSAIVNFGFKLKEATGILKMQLFYIFWSLFIAGLFGTIFNLLLPWLGNYRLIWIGPQFTILIVIVIIYAIARYKLFDTRILIGRLTYIALVALIPYTIFYIIILLNQSMFVSVFATRSMLLNIPISLLFVLFYDEANKFIRKKVESGIINPGFDPEIEITEFNRLISNLLDYDSIIEDTLKTISRTLRPSDVAILSKNSTGMLQLISRKDSINIKEMDKIEIFNDIQGLQNANFDMYEIEAGLATKNAHIIDISHKILNIVKNTDVKLIMTFNQKSDEINGAIVIGAKGGNKPYNSLEVKFVRSILDSLSVSLNRSFLYNEVQNFNMTLQKKVELATEELQQKNIELAEALRKERDMMDIIGHELRTPLSIANNAIGFMYDKYKDGTLTPDLQERYLDMATTNIKREKNLLQTILESARLENDRTQIVMNQVRVKEIIDNAVLGFEKDAQTKQLKLIVEEFDPNLIIETDMTALQQIVDNLTSNAIKYTFHGQVKISVADLGDGVEFSVQDTGEGIPKDQMINLGKKFFRINTYLRSSQSAETQKIIRPGGTGIGLYVVKGLLRAMGSELKVESEYGKGSRFSFVIPKMHKRIEPEINKIEEAKPNEKVEPQANDNSKSPNPKPALLHTDIGGNK
jgi:signal transduction histidine kinase